MVEISKIIINEVSGNHVVCGKCHKSHFGTQIYNDRLEDYICEECEIMGEGVKSYGCKNYFV